MRCQFSNFDLIEKHDTKLTTNYPILRKPTGIEYLKNRKAIWFEYINNIINFSA